MVGMEQTASPARPAPDARRMALSLGIAAVVVLLDQLTKAWIRGWLAEGDAWPSTDAWFAISHVENAGAAFGILQGATEFLLAAAVVGVLGLLLYLWRFPPQQPLYFLALSMILGGAIGNFIDRVTIGTVTDFIDPAYYPAFNIADSAIVVGIGAILLLTYIEERRA